MPEDLSGREGVPHNNATYTNGRCRCEMCTAAHAAYQASAKARRMGRLHELPADAHGLLSTYKNWGCRCEACRYANTSDSAARRAKKKVAHGSTVTRSESVDQPQSELVCDLGFRHIVVS